jgi:lipopolysaccharide transport system ATP-binding protein
LQTSSDLALSVRELSKTYRLGERDVLHGSLRDAIVRGSRSALHLARRTARPEREELAALDAVSFDVPRGEVLGIIGRNGAGKTTLLKVLSGVTDPTSGEARVWGRAGALLEVGTGFHPDLTGRENVFFNGAILGMKRREIQRKFDEIVEFAEVGRFIDTPVKRYSSGMQLRLAFAVAAHLEPEILIVDEVLAVGDAAFQRKCLGKMEEVSGKGRTVLLVSHNMSAITSLAERCLWLDQGRVRELGDPARIVADYLSGDAVSEQPGFADLSDDARREGEPKQTHGKVRFDWVRLRDDGGQTTNVFFEGEPLHVDLGIQSRAHSKRLEVLCMLTTLEGVLVFTLMTGALETDLEPGAYELSVTVPWNQLRPGRYQLDLYALTGLPQDYVRGAIQLEVAGSREQSENPRHSQPWGVVTVEHQWSELRPREPGGAPSPLQRQR